MRSARRTATSACWASWGDGRHLCPPAGRTHRVVSPPICGNSSGTVVVWKNSRLQVGLTWQQERAPLSETWKTSSLLVAGRGGNMRLQHAQNGHSGQVDSQLRALLPMFVGRQVDELPQTCSCGTSTFQCPSTMHVVWKLWWMASHHLEGHKLLLTRRSCQHYIVTGHPTDPTKSQGQAGRVGRRSCWQMVRGSDVFHQASRKGKGARRTSHPPNEG